MTPITVTIPGMRLRSVLNGSQGMTRGGRFARSRERRKLRSLACSLTYSYGFRDGYSALEGDERCQAWPFPMIVTITRLSSGSLDDDNLAASCKSVRDGVADALGVDDRDGRVKWQYAQRKVKRGVWGVEIHIGDMRSLGRGRATSRPERSRS